MFQLCLVCIGKTATYVCPSAVCVLGAQEHVGLPNIRGVFAPQWPQKRQQDEGDGGGREGGILGRPQKEIKTSHMDAPGCLGAFQFLRNELQAGTCRLIALCCHVATCTACHHEAPQLQLHALQPPSLPFPAVAVENKQMGTSEAATQRLRLD